MDCLILRAFEYSLDGHNLLKANVKDILDIPDAQVPGLFKEGFVGEPPVADPAESKEAKPAPAPSGKMMPPLENKDAGSPPSIAAAGKAPKSK
jgi:hypothetical protein